MLTGDKNLKDSPASNLDITIKDTSFQISYTKTNKLITALYMVTDIIDKGEPLRNKLRTLGAGIISDTYSAPLNICSKISEIMSFLDIASAVNIISEMNCNILRKEFSELDQSILSAQAGKESIGNIKTLNRQINLSEFFTKEYQSLTERPVSSGQAGIGHRRSTRIGVQKGSTLMKALSDKTHFMSNRNNVVNSKKNNPAPYEAEGFHSGFDILKKQRRDDIINIIKTVGESSTIKDIKDKVQANPEQAHFLVSCGEKTLQREMVSMVKDGVLNKTGKKRWSRYFLKQALGN
jgi:hypothetical protein